MKKIFIPVLFLGLSLFSCREEIPSDPVIEMVSVKALSDNDYFAKARITNAGDSPVSAYGFIVSKDMMVSGGYFYGLEFKAGNEPEADTFSYLISFDSYQEDTILYFQSYLVNKYGTMYSKQFRLDLNRLTHPGLNPAMAEQGDTINITGSGFDPVPDQNMVLFGEVTAKVVTANPNRLTVIVPSDLHHNSGGIAVSMIRSGLRYEIGYFRVVPKILSITPSSGTFNSDIRINFDNLASSYYDYYVSFGTANAWKKSSTGNNIIVKVPSNIKSKNLKIRVYNEYVECKSFPEFTIKPMTISAVSPPEGPVNTGVIIYGTGFNPNSTGNAVKIGNRFAFIENSDERAVVAIIPSGLSPGIYDIHIFNSIDTLVIKNGFRVTP